MTEPIKPNKYHGGKIYALRSPSTDKIYIGSTTQPLYKRKNEHKCHQLNEISKLDDFYIELLEDFKCENREQLNKREGELIRLNDKCVNKIKMPISIPEIRKEYLQNWRDNNKDKIAENNKIRVKCPNCDREIQQYSLSRHQKTYCKKNII